MRIGRRICTNRFLIESAGVLRILAGRSMAEHRMFCRSAVQAIQKDQVTYRLRILRSVHPAPERAGRPSEKSDLIHTIAMSNLAHYRWDIAYNLLGAS